MVWTRIMIMRYRGGRMDHGDSVTAAGLKSDPMAEVVCENPDTRFGFEDTESNDDDEAGDPAESMSKGTAHGTSSKWRSTRCCGEHL